MADDKKPTFEPLHKGHAIEQAAIFVHMDREIDDAAIADIKKAIGTPAELPKRAELRGITLAIGPTMPTPRPGPGVGGLSFSKIQADGAVETELRAERSAITFRTTLYTGWVNFWSQGRNYFDLLLPRYVDKVKISGVAINYIDKFVLNASRDNHTGSEILRPNSRFLAPHVYDEKDLWHSHTGWFERVDGATKRLFNVNVDFLDEQKDDQQSSSLVITTLLTDLLNQPGFEPFAPASADASAAVNERLGRLHDRCKDVLSGIISEEMCQRIALKG